MKYFRRSVTRVKDLYSKQHNAENTVLCKLYTYISKVGNNCYISSAGFEIPDYLN